MLTRTYLEGEDEHSYHNTNKYFTFTDKKIIKWLYFGEQSLIKIVYS